MDGWIGQLVAVYNWKIQYPRGLLISGDKEIDIDNERLQLQLQYLENQRPGIDKSEISGNFRRATSCSRAKMKIGHERSRAKSKDRRKAWR
ncbi:unnamed protein product [Dracunculus medinensis]|uniref:Transposase n=1 Tax=Dracunculus medinensis TaxID=318479 RepID=A0A0N4U5E2_DRAME|nr:unnamed protein product [Dracunculus medinensis]